MHLQALTGLIDSLVYTFGFTIPYLAGAAVVFANVSTPFFDTVAFAVGDRPSC